jgi:hypothetical protein
VRKPCQGGGTFAESQLDSKFDIHCHVHHLVSASDVESTAHAAGIRLQSQELFG